MGAPPAAYLTLLPEASGQRRHNLREVFYALHHWGVRWQQLMHAAPRLSAASNWSINNIDAGLAAGCFEASVDDLRLLLRLCAGRRAQPSATILDSRTNTLRIGATHTLISRALASANPSPSP